MFLKRNRRKIGGETYEYWSLVQTVRTARGPRHKLIAHLGKAPGLDRAKRRGWESVMDMLDGRDPKARGRQMKLGEEGGAVGYSSDKAPHWVQVDIQGLRIERVRDFGQAYLALALWRRLGLHQLLEDLFEPGKEQVEWELIACILVIARFCGNKSELEVAQRWYADSALEDLLGVAWQRVNDSRLYRGLDVLHGQKDALCRHLLERYRDWFGIDFEFLLYDITSTYFEGQALGNIQAKRGYSRDKRPDCKQVNIGLVVTPEGLPISYEVFDGNRADVTTVEAMVDLMEAKYGQARRTWVMDRGMVSEDNLELLRKRRATYLVATPKARLKAYRKQFIQTSGWIEVHDGLEVRLVKSPDGRCDEQYVLCRSRERREKEAAMLENKRAKLLAKLKEIDEGLRKRPAAMASAQRRVGRWLGRFTRAERFYCVEVLQDPDNGKATGLKIQPKEAPLSWAELSHGAYLLRTNSGATDPTLIWKRYLQLTQVEEAFRISKSDLNLRPVFHQKTERVQAHILVCFLTLAMWRSLEMWMKSKGLGDCSRQLIKEVSTIRSMDVILPVRDGTELRLRVVARPDKSVAQLLAHLGLKLPNVPKIISNVV
ncbi:MAG: IS1634 family transposase [Opitutae bacterium]|nr:IS1634 family transposase [Opitutae bacterium]